MPIAYQPPTGPVVQVDTLEDIINEGPLPVEVQSLPLPAGAATESTLATQPIAGAPITGATIPTGGSGTYGWLSAIWKVITDRLPASLVSGRLDVNVGAGTVAVTDNGGSLTVDGAVSVTDGGGSLTVDGTFWQTTQPVSLTVTPLPSGAATSPLQQTGNASLASIDGKTPTLASGRVPVDGSGVTQPVSLATIPLATGAATETTLAAQPAAGTAITGATMPAGGAATYGWLSAIWKAITDRLPAALVSGRLDVNVGAGTVNVADGGGSITVDGNVGISGTVPVSDGGGSVTVDGSVSITGTAAVTDNGGSLTVDGTFWQTTQPVSAASLPLPSGAATSAAQTTGNTSLGNIDTKTPTLVTGRVPVDGSGVTQPVSASALPLPTGAASETTLAAQPTAGTVITGATIPTGGAGTYGWLSAIWKAITDRLPAALVSGRLDVNVGASATLPISASALPLPTGAATSAAQSTGNGSLGNIDTKTPTLVSGRVPVDPSGVTQPVNLKVGGTDVSNVNPVPVQQAGLTRANDIVATALVKGTTPTVSNTTPGTSSTLLLAANTARLYGWIVNTGTQILYVYPGAAATLVNGYPLYPGMGIPDPHGTSAWYGITASGTGACSSVEYGA